MTFNTLQGQEFVNLPIFRYFLCKMLGIFYRFFALNPNITGNMDVHPSLDQKTTLWTSLVRF